MPLPSDLPEPQASAPAAPPTRAASAARPAPAGLPAPRVATLSGARPASDHIVGDPNNRFFLVHHFGRPGSWVVEETDEGPTAVPVLEAYPIVAGAAGVRTAGQGERPESAYDQVILKLQRSGSIVIMPEETADGTLPDGYLRDYDCRGQRGTGQYFCCAWETPIPGLMPGDRVHVEIDHEKRRAYALALLRLGRIPPMPVQLKRYMQRTLERAVTHAHGADQEGRKALVEQQVARRDAFAEATTGKAPGKKGGASATTPGKAPGKKGSTKAAEGGADG